MIAIAEIAYRPVPEAALADGAPIAWLDGDGASPQGRYSYLCRAPFAAWRFEEGWLRGDGPERAADPLQALQQALARWRLPPIEAPVPFVGGAVGYLGYHLSGLPDHRPSRHPPLPGLPDMALGFHDVVLALDHAERRAWILSSGLPEIEPSPRMARAARRQGEMATWWNALPADGAGPPACPPPSWRAERSGEDHRAAIRRALNYIAAGDIFQANLSLRFLAERPKGFDAGRHYLRRRRDHRAPFAAFLRFDPDLALASFSPERFLRLSADGEVETRPIKGSCPRGVTPEDDEALGRALRDSPKNRAENLMIADLMRNDLGRVARPGSVRAPQLHALERFPAIHHLVSVVEARLRPGLGAADLLRAAFPGGSVTGAPKIRAMEIIDEMEAAHRGPYCGAIGWFGWDGAMDTSIVIRTIVAAGDRLILQAGGGIVADSDPEEEHREALLKAAPLLRPC